MMKSILLATLLFGIYLRQGLCITISPAGTVPALVSHSTRFICKITGSCFKFNWAGPALQGGMDRVTIDGIAGSNLRITDLRADDEGNYSCSCNNQQTSVYLDIIRLPTVREDTEQTIHEGTVAHIQCNADPGDPPVRPTWSFNGVDILERHHIEDNLVLRIDNVTMEDAGTYTCAFNLETGYIMTNTMVTVVPETTGIQFEEPTRHSVVINYGDPLVLNCRVTNSTPVNISWMISVGPRVQYFHSSTLNFGPEQVQSGLYRCLAYKDNIRKSYDVHVTVHAKPVFPVSRKERAEVVKAPEGSALNNEEMTVNTAPIIGGLTTIQWTRKSSGELVEFGSRLSVIWEENRVKWSISTASLDDDGQFFMNVSNEFGSTILPTTLKVSKLPKVTVYVRISKQPCQLLKNHKEELARTIAIEYLVCQRACAKSLLDTVKVRCEEDDDTAIVSMAIPTDHVTDDVMEVSFSLAGRIFTGTVIETPSVTPVTPEPNEGVLPTDIIIPVVVLASICIVVVAAALITVAIIKCRNNGQAVINPEAPEIDSEKGICSGYKEMKRNEVVLAVPTSPVTPVDVPVTPVLTEESSSSKDHLPNSQQLYIPPSPTPGTRKSPPPGSSAERPTQLYIRSYSYSYSARTPPDQRSRPQ